jgi:hypothetical protein
MMKSAVLTAIASLLLVACSGGSSQPVQPTATPGQPTAAQQTAAPAQPTVAQPTAAPAQPTVAQPTAAPPAATAPPAPAASGNNGGTDIRRIADAMSAATSYRVQMTTITDQGPIQSEWEVVKPDRMHTTSQQQGRTFEMVIIGQDNYINSNGVWNKVPSGGGPVSALTFNANEIVAEFTASMEAGDVYTPGGLDNVNGTACQELVVMPADPERQGGSWCIGLSDSLPRRHTSPALSGTMIFSDWNTPIRIDPPI